jgi:hypothetical protein
MEKKSFEELRRGTQKSEWKWKLKMREVLRKSRNPTNIRWLDDSVADKLAFGHTEVSVDNINDFKFSFKNRKRRKL